jgi:hypothetical protein
MKVRLITSLQAMKSIEWTLLLLSGFLVIREMNSVWLLSTEIFMPIVVPVSTALYIIYTVLLTGATVLVAILFLICEIGINSEKCIDIFLKDMTTDKIESLKIEQPIWVQIRVIIEDILIVYFSWTLGRHYLAILAVIANIESRWFLIEWSKIVDKLKNRFYSDLQKEVAAREKAEFEKEHESDLL